MAGRIILWVGWLFALFPLFAQTDTGKTGYGLLESSVPDGTNQKESVLHFFKLADDYMDADRYDSAEYWLGKVGDRLGFNKPGIFNYYYHSRQAEVFYYNNLLQLGLQQANRALQIALNLKDSLFIADAYNFLGLFSLNLEKHTDAEKFLLLGLRYFGSNPTVLPPIALSEVYHLHGNLGEVFTKLKKFDRALLHFDSSRLKAREKNAFRAEALALISAGDVYLETGVHTSAESSLLKGLQLALAHQDFDVALYGNGNLALLYAQSGNRKLTYSCINRGKLIRETYPELNPFYSLLYLRKATEALGILRDYQGVATMQAEIIRTEEDVKRKSNWMIEDVLSTGLKNENKLLQLEIQEARQKQKDGNIRVVGLLLIIAILLLAGLFYRNNIRQKLEVAGIREKISQNLHDDIGASISSLHIYSTIAQETLLKQPEKTLDLLERITRQSKILMENMSDMVWSMKAYGDDGMSLSTRIKNFGSELLTVQNIQCKYDIDEEAFRLFSGYESRKNILLIIKEAMNNIAKYSGASQAFIRLQKQNEQSISIMVSDNGIGFDEGTVAKGNGLKNMGARVKELKGILTIETAPGSGTILKAIIPIP